MTTLHIDFETRSAVDLKKTGVHRYAEDPSTDVWCAAFAVDDGPVELWRMGDDFPFEVQAAFTYGWTIIAHNAAFERAIWAGVLAPRYGWPIPRLEWWQCTMAMALAMSLPASLGEAAAALGLEHRKDMTGHRLMMQMAKPRPKPRTGPDDGTLRWWDEPEKLERLYAYCATDVETERALEKRLLKLRPAEQALWHLDQRINDRGVQVDVRLCQAAQKVVDAVKIRADEEMIEVTGGEVVSVSATAQLAAFCNSEGMDGDSVAKDQVERMLIRDDLTPALRRALEIRQEAGKAAVLKIPALLNGMCSDGRARGLLQFHGASTGRWAGRRFMPHNMKRPQAKDIPQAIETILFSPTGRLIDAGDIDLVELCHGPALNVVGDCIRGMVCAAPDAVLDASDLANIEGRVLAWLAGEVWKIQAFREFDAKIGPDLYKLAYGRAFGVDPGAVGDDSQERQVGKVMELALGYQGGVGAFLTMAKTYGVKIGDGYDSIMALAPATVAEQAEKGFVARGRASGVERKTWIAAETVKLLWRGAHPATCDLWNDVEDAAIDAVQSPGKVIHCGKLQFRVAGSFLFMRLPSGRALCYPYPRIMRQKMPWKDRDGNPVFRPALTYKTVPNPSNMAKIVDDPTNTSRWARISTYGGSLVENAVQAIARDVMVEGMLRHEAAGYEIVLTVHDEVVAESPAGFGSSDEFSLLMAIVPEWADGLPVAAKGWRAERYRK